MSDLVDVAVFGSSLVTSDNLDDSVTRILMSFSRD